MLTDIKKSNINEQLNTFIPFQIRVEAKGVTLSIKNVLQKEP
jgi:hypothetical protein